MSSTESAAQFRSRRPDGPKGRCAPRPQAAVGCMLVIDGVGGEQMFVGATSGLLQIPAYSGRIFLFGSTTDYGLNRLST